MPDLFYLVVFIIVMGYLFYYTTNKVKESRAEPEFPTGVTEGNGMTIVQFKFMATQNEANIYQQNLADIYNAMKPEMLEVLGFKDEDYRWGFTLYAMPGQFDDPEGEYEALNGLTKYYHVNQVWLRVFKDSDGLYMFRHGGAWSWELRNIFRYRLLGLQEFETHETDEAMQLLVNKYLSHV